MKDYQILVDLCFAEVYEDSYENGELGFVNQWDMSSVKGVYNSIDELIEKLSDWGFSNKIKDYYFIDNKNWGEITSDILVDEYNYPVTEKDKDFKLWKSGEINLYAVRLMCRVKLIETREMTNSDAKALGLEIF